VRTKEGLRRKENRLSVGPLWPFREGVHDLLDLVLVSLLQRNRSSYSLSISSGRAMRVLPQLG
jgi:hypothetical protein